MRYGKTVISIKVKRAPVICPTQVSTMAKTDENSCRLCLLPNATGNRNLEYICIEGFFATDVLAQMFGYKDDPDNTRLPRKICRSCFGKLEQSISLWKIISSNQLIRSNIKLEDDSHENIQGKKVEEKQEAMNSVEEMCIELDDTVIEHILSSYEEIKDEEKLLTVENLLKIEEDIDQYDFETRKEILKTYLDQIESEQESYSCGLCPSRYESKEQLGAHLKLHLNTEEYNGEPSHSLQNNSKSTNHAKPHVDSATSRQVLNVHECSNCGKVFKRNYDLKMHELLHNSENSHFCLDCRKGFRSEMNLAAHVKRNHGVKKHACTDCGKRFSEKSHFTAHILVHKNEKSHVCTDCGKAFRYKTNLKNHYTAHSVETPWKCSVTGCGKSYKRKQTLMYHQAYDHERRKYAQKQANEETIQFHDETKTLI